MSAAEDEKLLEPSLSAFKTWLAASGACAEAGKQYAAKGTAENRRELAASARALAEAGRALAEARVRFRAAVEREMAPADQHEKHAATRYASQAGE